MAVTNVSPIMQIKIAKLKSFLHINSLRIWGNKTVWEYLLKKRQWRRSGIFIVNFEHISHLVPVFIVNFEHVIAVWERLVGLIKSKELNLFLLIYKQIQSSHFFTNVAVKFRPSTLSFKYSF